MADKVRAGRNLASERARLGMTQGQLAERLGTNAKSISQYEKGEYSLPSELAEAMADLCRCSTDYLFGRCDERLPRGTAVTYDRPELPHGSMGNIV